jgi:hypothetical protein
MGPSRLHRVKPTGDERMKKRMKKLRLGKETLRNLAERSLDQVQRGISIGLALILCS